MSELSNEELMVASAEDWQLYLKCIDGLPDQKGFNGDFRDKYGVHIPYSSGPHLIRHFFDTLTIVKPAHILEIGFNLGYSSAIWLDISTAKVLSVDISDKDETIYAAEILKQRYPDRFDFVLSDSAAVFDALQSAKFDLVFIDGGHEEENVTPDIQLAKDLEIPYLLFDDCYARFGPGVMPSIAKFNLELVKDMHNVKLYTWTK